MERLTERERNVDGTGVAREEITDGLLKPFADKILTKLADYEDLEEQGLLVRLPCKVGEKLWCIVNGTICELRVYRFDMSAFGTTDIVFRYADGFKLERFVGEIGKTIFLNREEAKKKLEEIQNDKT